MRPLRPVFLFALVALFLAADSTSQWHGGWYMIVGRGSGLCLQAPAPGIVQLQQARCHGGANQVFAAEQVPNSPFFLFRVQASGFCVDVEGANPNHGARVFQHPCNGNWNQQFRTQPVGYGAVLIQARHSDLCLDTPNWYEGAPLHQAFCNRPDFQQWYLRQVG